MAGIKLIYLLLVCITSFNGNKALNNRTFPDDFWFGFATAAFQIEGGWDADGKTPSYWDWYNHQVPSPIEDKSNADVASDSYHLYETDVRLMKDMGVTHYRFSISWPRILPTGYADVINQPGVDYYKKLIKLLKENNIIPLITLYHADLPLNFYFMNGLMNSSFIDWFADYARVCFDLFGEDVKYWTTINEAIYACSTFNKDPGYDDYICAHNVLRAHAAAYRIYENEFRAKQGGKVTMVHAISWHGPRTNSSEDIAASERVMQYDLGWFANPTYYGDYPDVMKEELGDRLPNFTDEEKALIKGTSDFFCYNTYKSYVTSNIPNPNPNPTTRSEVISVKDEQKEGEPNGAWGIKPLSQWIQSHYNDPDIIVTENGLAVLLRDDSLDDDNRVTYIQDYMSGVLDALDSNVKLFGYTLWSLMDNFEWYSGYNHRLGVHHIDFTDPNRTRTPRKSAGVYKKIIKTRCLVDNCV